MKGRNKRLVDQPADALAAENARLKGELEAARAAALEALEQQTATSEILRVIARAPTDLQPVFDAIARRAARLCDAFDVIVLRVEGDRLRLVAHHGSMPAGDVALHRGTVGGRTVLDRTVIHIADLQAESDEFPEGSAIARARGHHTNLSVPLLRGDVAIGNIQIRRNEIRPFSDTQIALLETFADQAVIALENVRLFSELCQNNEALAQAHAQVTEALEQQTASADILRVISRSPTDVEPVFDHVVERALRLLGGLTAAVVLLRDGVCHLGAFTALDETADAAMRNVFPRPLSELPLAARVVRDGTARLIEDAQSDELLNQPARDAARARGYRSLIAVPLIRDGAVLGMINVSHREAGAFDARHIAILQTFADQAVIAIENVRLFTELQARNRAVTEALEQQTATSEILQVISRTPDDTRPVFEVIAQNAVRICEGYFSVVFVSDGERLRVAATHNLPSGWFDDATRAFPAPLDGDTQVARAVRERRIVHVLDMQNDAGVAEGSRRRARVSGYRTWIAVPMLGKDRSVGTIAVSRRETKGFSDAEVTLLQTFADQAVIAIENVRLFTELEARNRDLTATSEILGVIAASPTNVQPVFDAIAASAQRLTAAHGVVILLLDGEMVQLAALAGGLPGAREFYGDLWPRPLREADVVADAIRTGSIILSANAAEDVALSDAMRALARTRNMGAFVCVPMRRAGQSLGVMFVTRPEPFSNAVVALLATFADQAVIAIENVRLFTALEQRTAQLQVANRHKDEFLANMSHELRTPLNGIIGFSEVMLERMFGEVNEKQEEYLGDILSSGRHLLSLINDILDLSKIEAGRMELELTEFHAPTAIDNALMLMRERAARRGQVLDRAVDPALAQLRADERKFKQVLLNLLSNAVKFTPEGGRITVRGGVANGDAVVSVTDTGVGIAPEHQDLVFEEFRQVGHADKKAEGTGLGLALCRKFIELHGGRISLVSELGKGSTFSFVLPLAGPPATP